MIYKSSKINNIDIFCCISNTYNRHVYLIDQLCTHFNIPSVFHIVSYEVTSFHISPQKEGGESFQPLLGSYATCTILPGNFNRNIYNDNPYKYCKYLLF